MKRVLIAALLPLFVVGCNDSDGDSQSGPSLVPSIVIDDNNYQEFASVGISMIEDGDFLELVANTDNGSLNRQKLTESDNCPHGGSITATIDANFYIDPYASELSLPEAGEMTFSANYNKCNFDSVDIMSGSMSLNSIWNNTVGTERNSLSTDITVSGSESFRMKVSTFIVDSNTQGETTEFDMAMSIENYGALKTYSTVNLYKPRISNYPESGSYRVEGGEGTYILVTFNDDMVDVVVNGTTTESFSQYAFSNL